MPTAVLNSEPTTQAQSSEPASARARIAPVWPFPLRERLQILRRFRHLLAADATHFAGAITTLPRTPADTLVAEVLPLLAAIQFLEREAKSILAPRHLGKRGLPRWLAGLEATIERVPLGSVLILAPYNYPLLLPGVQAAQAIAAGNTVVWKPGRGGDRVAQLFERLLAKAGLPEGVLRVTDDSIEAAQAEISRKPAKILFTGSAQVGRQVLHAAAETLTPVVAELSGCDAVFVLPDADPSLVVDALLFGLRLNGSQTCMAPRRLILVNEPAPEALSLRHRHDFRIPAENEDQEHCRPLHPTHQKLLTLLDQAISTLPDVPNTPPFALLDQARAVGAAVTGAPGRPYLVLNATPAMAIARSDTFYPVLSVLRAASPGHAVRLHQQSALSLTAAIFGRSGARDLASHLTTGTILLNDLIVPTADPRIPFGGRGDSGFGLTRGREGLLELTTTKTTTLRTGRNYRHFQPTTAAHVPLFTGLIELSHAATWRARYAGLRKMIAAARSLNA